MFALLEYYRPICRENMTINETEQTSILRAVFDALPSMVFVVDQDVRIQEYNAAASELLKAGRMSVLKLRTGEILHCIHSNEVPEGCGRAPFCENCIVRNSVTEAFRGNRVVRRRTRIDLIQDGEEIEIYALITASPFSFQDKSLVLLVIEDISEIAEIKRLIPICAVCKKVRDDKEAWMQVEAYLKNNWDVNCTHGYCPECYKSEMDKLTTFIKTEQGIPSDD